MQNVQSYVQSLLRKKMSFADIELHLCKDLKVTDEFANEFLSKFIYNSACEASDDLFRCINPDIFKYIENKIREVDILYLENYMARDLGMTVHEAYDIMECFIDQMTEIRAFYYMQ